MDSGPKIPLLEVVLVGGGHAHVHVIKMLGMNPVDNVRFTLVTKDVMTPYSGMLPGYIAGYYNFDECHIDLGKLCSFARFRLVNAEVTEINTMEKLILCNDGRPPLSYDILSINIGIVPRPLDANKFGTLDNAGQMAPITAVKPIDKFAQRWDHILARVLEHDFTKPFAVAVVGAGAGGVELCFAVHHRLKAHLQERNLDRSNLKVILLNKGDTIMSSHCQ